ncbi:MAG: hypothetical protein ACE366_11775 [Bradymonadia bacterium]
MTQIFIVCEASADADTVKVLADRVICEVIDWIDPDTLQYSRTWCERSGQSHLKWTQLKKDWKAHNPHRHVHGKYGGSEKGEHIQARKAIILIFETQPDVDALILSRDTDAISARRKAFEDARACN